MRCSASFCVPSSFYKRRKKLNRPFTPQPNVPLVSLSTHERHALVIKTLVGDANFAFAGHRDRWLCVPTNAFSRSIAAFSVAPPLLTADHIPLTASPCRAQQRREGRSAARRSSPTDADTAPVLPLPQPDATTLKRPRILKLKDGLPIHEHLDRLLTKLDRQVNPTIRPHLAGASFSNPKLCWCRPSMTILRSREWRLRTVKFVSPDARTIDTQNKSPIPRLVPRQVKLHTDLAGSKRLDRVADELGPGPSPALERPP